MSLRLRGIIPAVLTPFTPDGDVNEAELRAHLDFLIDGGVHALFPVGTTGEGPLLKSELRKRVAQVCVDHVAGRVPVMIHTGAASTAETIELSRHAAAIGADAASVVTPYYYIYDMDSLFGHFTAVARSVPELPVVLYNNPSKANNTISPELFARLRKTCSNVIGVKDTSGSVQNLQEYIAAVDDETAVLTGSNTLILACLAVGAAGAISTVANCFPEIMVDMYEDFIGGDLATARRKQQLVHGIWRAFNVGQWPGIQKLGLQLRGRSFSRRVTPPLREPTPAEEERLRAALSELGVIK